MGKEKNITAYSQIRRLLGRAFGQQYGGRRDMFSILGYPSNISFVEYYGKYIRQDIAGAIINRPIEATWRGDINISNADDESEVLKKNFAKLRDDLKLKNKFIRLDKLTSIGRYGILLLGFNDVQDVKEFKNPVQKSSNLKLLYAKPHSEYSAVVHKLEKDTTNKRFGLPLYYKIKLGGAELDRANTDDISLEHEIVVHYSRVLHVVGETLDSEIYGVPVLQRVYNRLMDLEKLVGGSAEMFWRGARPGVQGKVDEDYTADENLLKGIENQLEEFDHDLRRVVLQEGVDLKTLAQQIADPRPNKEVQIDMIAAVTAIPKRILTGSERGELASSQDQDNWHDMIEGRREEYAEEQILFPFVERLIGLGILPPQEKYDAEWRPLGAVNEKDKSQVGELRAKALKAYTDNSEASSLMPFEMFMKYFLGFAENTIDEIMNLQETILADEDEEGFNFETEIKDE